MADAVVIKDANLFFLARGDGDVPLGGTHGFGLYYHDCRFLDGYELRIGGASPIPLVATAADGFGAAFELTNPAFEHDGTTVGREAIGLRWERTIDAETPALRERLTLHNFSFGPVTLPIDLGWSAAFEDVFAVRGMRAARRGVLHPARWVENRLVFRYDGADQIVRTVTILLSPAPASVGQRHARYRVELEPGGGAELLVSAVITESSKGEDLQPPPDGPDIGRVRRQAARATSRWLAGRPALHSDHAPLDRVMDRSLRDLHALRTELHGERYFAAGVPWYVALFGRDSCLAALQTLAWDASMAGHTLGLLARFQGRGLDRRRDEAPGKILHELRVGELAHLGHPADAVLRHGRRHSPVPRAPRPARGVEWSSGAFR